MYEKVTNFMVIVLLILLLCTLIIFPIIFAIISACYCMNVFDIADMTHSFTSTTGVSAFMALIVGEIFICTSLEYNNRAYLEKTIPNKWSGKNNVKRNRNAKNKLIKKKNKAYAFKCRLIFVIITLIFLVATILGNLMLESNPIASGLLFTLLGIAGTSSIICGLFELSKG